MSLGRELTSSSSPEAGPASCSPAQTHQCRLRQQPADAPLADPGPGLPDPGGPAQLGQQIRDSQHSRGHTGLNICSSTLANKYSGELSVGVFQVDICIYV